MFLLNTKNNHHHENNQRDGRKLREAMDMSMVLIVMIVSWVYMDPQTQRVVCIKYVQLFTCQSSLKQMVKKKSPQETRRKKNLNRKLRVGWKLSTKTAGELNWGKNILDGTKENFVFLCQ